MKKLKRIAIIASVLAAAILLFACPWPKNDEPKPTPAPPDTSVDFGSHNTDYSIMVRNGTGERLVAFKGELKAEALVGGIPAHANNHGLPKNLTLFDKTEDFPLIILTEAQYNANKGDLNSQKNTPFTRVYVFYNKSGDNTSVYEIAEGLGGNNTFEIINNSTSINIELRINGVAGETLGYAPAGIMTTNLKLNDGNYQIFPVFKRYNQFRDIVETVTPKASDGSPWYRTYSFGEGTTSASMNLKNLLQGTKFSSGAAWVYVSNQTESGVRFLEGSQVHKTASGLDNIMTTRTFQIDMPKVGANNYATSLVVSNWKFGPNGNEVQLQTSSTDTTPVTDYTIELDKMYTVTVSGDHNAGNLKAYISNITDIPQSDIGGAW